MPGENHRVRESRKGGFEEESEQNRKGSTRKQDQKTLEDVDLSVAAGMKQREGLLQEEVGVTEATCSQLLEGGSQTYPASSNEPFYPPAPLIVSHVPSHHLRVASPARFDILHLQILEPFSEQNRTKS